MKVLAIVPARGGSKRLFKKNLRKIGSKTLIENTIEQALQSKLIDKIVFSSENKEMLDNANQYVNKIDIVYRNPKLSEDNIELCDVARDIASSYRDYNIIVILQVDHPFRTPQMIDECIKLILNNLAHDVITIKNNKRTGNIRALSREALYSGLPTGYIRMIEEDPDYIDIHTEKDLKRANDILLTKKVVNNCF